MKTSIKIIIGAGLFILLAGTIGICVHHYYGHQGKRDIRVTAYFHQQRMGHRPMWGKNRQADMPMIRGMRPGMERGPGNGMREDMNRGQMNGMRRGMGPGQINGMGRGMGNMPMDPMWRGNTEPGRMMEMIPGLTEKQKKDIADLRQQQKDEMKKMRDEITKKMQDLRETHKKKVMDMLTPEQKKFVESHNGIEGTPPSK
jgi:hypothetical protein